MKTRAISLCALSLLSCALYAQDSEDYYGPPRIYSETKSLAAQAASANAAAAALLAAKVPTKDLIAQYSATKEWVVTAVPSQFSSKFVLATPENNATVVRKKIVVTGQNTYMTPTYVNGQMVRLQDDGTFSTELDVEAYGLFSVYCTFITPDQHFFIVKRDVLSLALPDDIDNFALNRKQLISFFNSSYFYNPDHTRQLLDPLTRADLAYFMAKLKNADIKQKLSSRFQDIPENAWFSQSVLFVVNDHIMSEFPDGLFRPQKPVTKLEYIVTLVRAMKLEFDQSNSDLPYRDVKPNHWSAKFIRTALKAGLIKPDPDLNLESALTVADFISLTQAIPDVQRTLAALPDSFAPLPVATANVEAFLYPILAGMKSEQPQVAPVEHSVQFSSPNKPITGTTSDSLVFEGVVFPAEPFDIGAIHVVPSADGKFVYSAPLALGKNDISLTIFGKEYPFKAVRFPSYADLNGHWAELPVAKLRFLRVLDDEAEFKPSKQVTREEFVLWLSRALDWPLEPVEVPRVPGDLDKNNPNYLIYLKALQLGVVSTDDKGHFRPKAGMTKAEAITALTQAVPIQQFPVVYNGKFPFVDVPAKHWARFPVEQALKIGMVSPAASFFPSREMTRAEYATLLYRLPSVQLRLDAVISHD